MRPTALEVLRGVRALLLEEVLPEVAAPQLRTQVSLAIGLLDAAAVELDDAPAAYAEERARLTALAAEALPLVRRLDPDDPLAAELAALSTADPPAAGSLRAMEAESARLLAALDALAAFCDERAGAGVDEVMVALGGRVRGEVAALVARRQRWSVGGAPG